MKKTTEKTIKYWSKALEGVTTEVGVLASVRRNRTETLPARRKADWASFAGWDWLH